ncbi:MAG: Methylamine utilization protein mauG [Myxococcaceae bacterium]|nr:Methylamine utilization protein mauG [Myxococcaceae bacterium]
MVRRDWQVWRSHFRGVLAAGALGALACGDDGAAPIVGIDAGDGALPMQPVSGQLDGGMLAPDGAVAADAGWVWQLPRAFPTPAVPSDNPISQAKVEAGRHVFYDKRLSDNQTQSCASCHKQELAFADTVTVSVGSTGQSHTRSPMSLANVAYAPTLTWANPLMLSLERQAQVPIFGDEPVELGMKSMAEVEQRLQAVPRYVQLFTAAFPDEAQPITMSNVLKALASFERTLVSGDAPYDRWQAGDESALSDSAKRGHALFNSEKLECFHCHTGFDFSDHVAWQGQAFVTAPFHNTGLYDIDMLGGYPAPNTGVHEVTMKGKDMGMFKAPTLRNIALTAPYMHDGSIATLSGVLDHYAAGGRAKSFRTDPLLVGFTLTEQERADVIAFLESLTDQGFVTNPKYADPWTAAPPIR